MKRLCPFSLSVLLILVLAVPAYGSTPEYLPSAVSLTIAPGSYSEIPFTVDVDICYSHVYDVLFVDRLEGSIPDEWVSASPASAFMICRGPSVSTSVLRIAVPDTAAPGEYSAYMFSRAIGAQGFTEPVKGMYINVHVPSGCGGAPDIRIDSVDLSNLRTSKVSSGPVEITGRIILPEGCELNEAGYSIDDEYDTLTGIGTITVGKDNTFSAYVTLSVTGRTGDSDGRNYTITVYAITEAGIGQSRGMDLVVLRDPHDEIMRK